jgi:hypothetical protein
MQYVQTSQTQFDAVHSQCFCAAVRLRITQPLDAPVNCHCKLCRRLSGAAFTTWLSIPLESLEISGEDYLSVFSPTGNLTRKFCKSCGSHVVTLDKRHPENVGVYAGMVDEKRLPPPNADYFVYDKAAWFTIPQGAKCFGGKTGFIPVNN